MNWKKESENELRDFANKLNALTNIPDHIKNIEYELSYFKQFNNENIRLEDLFIDNIMKKCELERNLLLTKQRVELIEHGLCSITGDERKILEHFYINHSDNYIEILSDELGYGKSSIYNLKDIALRKFTLAMYGIRNS